MKRKLPKKNKDESTKKKPEISKGKDNEIDTIRFPLPDHWPRYASPDYYNYMMCSMPDCAIVADWSKQAPYNSYSPVFWYEDETRKCRDCRIDFLWSKQEKRFWYEDLKIPIYVEAHRCAACRKKHREVKEELRAEAFRQMDEAAKRRSHPNELFFTRISTKPQRVKRNILLERAIRQAMDEEISQILGHEFNGELNLDDKIDEKAAAEFLGIALRTLTTWRAKGTGPAFLQRIAQSRALVHYTRRALVDWVRARNQNGRN